MTKVAISRRSGLRGTVVHYPNGYPEMRMSQATTGQVGERRRRSKLLTGCGRGPGGHAAWLALPAGRCPVPGCGEPIDLSRLMCRRDWYAIPRPLRDRVWATWRSGRDALSPDHLEAVRLAIMASQALHCQP
jgi:hypothetical protein